MYPAVGSICCCYLYFACSEAWGIQYSDCLVQEMSTQGMLTPRVTWKGARGCRQAGMDGTLPPTTLCHCFAGAGLRGRGRAAAPLCRWHWPAGCREMGGRTCMQWWLLLPSSTLCRCCHCMQILPPCLSCSVSSHCHPFP